MNESQGSQTSPRHWPWQHTWTDEADCAEPSTWSPIGKQVMAITPVRIFLGYESCECGKRRKKYI